MPSHSMRVSPPWRVYGGGLLQPAPFLVAGIVNITPDSFSDGGHFFSLDHAIARVRQVVAEGPHIVDLGAESTRPGAEDIGSGEEWRRLGPVLRQTLQLRAAQRFSVSIDTFRAATAAAALSLPMDGKPGSTSGPLQGADIINDISGASFDPAMPEVLAGFKPGYVLGHSPSLPSCIHSCPKY